MEAASCFLTSKFFNKAPELLVPSFRAKLPLFHRIRQGQLGFQERGLGRIPSSSVSCCSFKPLPQDDDDEPMIKSDWRSFRARLVASQQASTLAGPLGPDAMDEGPTPLLSPGTAIGEKWAHLIHEPEKGCLLLATDKLDGVHIFERTVILLLSCGPLAPTGVILNRPSLMSIKETSSVNLDVAGVFADRPLFFGGPLEDGLFLMGPRKGEDGSGSGVFEKVMEGVYYGTKESVGCAAEMVKRNVVGVGDFRFFDGYCRWERWQLREEIRSGLWRVVACSPSVVGVASMGSVGLWEGVLGLVEGRKVW